MLDLALSTLAVMLGSVVQGVTGMGSGFVIVPLLALIDLSLVPGPLVFASLALSLSMAARGRTTIDYRRVPVIVAGIVPGSMLGAWVLSRVSAGSAGLVFGCVILTAVAMSVAGFRVSARRPVAFLAGATSGVLGAAAGIGGPVLALLYQDEAGERLRATLGLLYACGAVVILASLYGVGRFGVAELLDGLSLVPGFLAGYVLAGRMTGRFPERFARPTILLISTAAAGLLIVRSV